ncbi:MAG: sugar phosphate isomerase/epimerase [Christensenella sp.]|uniref:sugar phosphate isomerase/epimerase family protein n=1 Tax=Christensenella sp. TaxID=1935934 RepID=UPI002B1F3A9D|nr:sugar phosphate isomerase/epimerase [Christensenella sp.]MEA5002391.1 sugar phosphate isomerase/epimerase [Christensenella sp.]
MKLGFVSAILPEYSFEQLIDYSSKIGMDCVEVAAWPVGKAERRYAGVTHIDVASLDKEKADYINNYLQERNVEISAIGYYPNPLDPDPAVRKTAAEHIKKCIEGARILGLHNMNTFIGKDPSLPISENMKLFREIWPDIIKCAEDNDVKVGIENCAMFYSMDEWPGGKNLASTPAIWTDMFSIIDSKNFGLNYDPSHFVWPQMDYIQPIYDFADKMFHFHIKDVKFYADRYNKVGMMATPLEYHAPKLPGLGDIDWGKTMSALYDIHYKGPAVIEVEDRAFEDTIEDKLHSIELSQRYMRNFI